ncbi:MAG: hypothetical protein OYH77_02870 [Pseudomonadota bacterium]|nr:hypothetical protein [Pseudomonadota bacterium]
MKTILKSFYIGLAVIALATSAGAAVQHGQTINSSGCAIKPPSTSCETAQEVINNNGCPPQWAEFC